MDVLNRKLGDADLLKADNNSSMKMKNSPNTTFESVGAFLQYSYDRLRREYFMRPRLQEFDVLLQFLKSHGYVVFNVFDFAEVVKTNVERPRKCCIMRIDVDSDPNFCLALSNVLRKNECDASFYFRLCTMDGAVMRELADFGFEVGYHYEELATLAKKYHLKSRHDVIARIDECRSEFRKNFAYFSKVLGSSPATVASHGDFANRKLSQNNTIIVDDAIRRDLAIYAEAYDDDLVSAFDHSIIDSGPPGSWHPDSPEHLAMEAGEKPHCMRILIHPKPWRNNFYWNTKQIIERVVEGMLY
jgi:hypothetical protein